MSSETSTEPGAARADSGFEVWHFYVLLAMVGATVAVMLSRNTHPAALLLLSGAVLASGIVGLALHRALMGLLDGEEVVAPLRRDVRLDLEREKALTLRSIKELEFDRAMGKVSDKDFEDVSSRLRARALTIMADLERAPATPPAAPARRASRPASQAAPTPSAPETVIAAFCAACGCKRDADAKFCKQCGTRLDPEGADAQ
jgi:hypothetical protein